MARAGQALGDCLGEDFSGRVGAACQRRRKVQQLLVVVINNMCAFGEALGDCSSFTIFPPPWRQVERPFLHVATQLRGCALRQQQ